MMMTLFAVLVVVAVGSRAIDAVRLSQAESILAWLPEDDARAYYDVLRRRVRRTLVMRGIVLLALLCIFWAIRQRLYRGS
jgi:membrane protein required for beta-lactamase induction